MNPISHLLQKQVVPLSFLADASSKICLVILNQPLQECKTLLQHAWRKACFKVCADGGANRLYDLLKASEETSKYVPDLISGDFDSIRHEVMEFYRSKGTSIVETPDQNETDFTKALRELYNFVPLKCEETEDFDSTIVIAPHSGRLDHTMANINTLYKASKMNEKPCYLLSESSVACLLQPGKTVISVNTGYEGDWCGLIPIGSPATVATSGLKWNLDNDQLRFGSLISTSNTFKGSTKVVVETSEPLLWIMEVDPKTLIEF